MMYPNLKKYGFSENFEREAAAYPGLFPARVAEQHRELYVIISERGELRGEVSGRARFGAGGNADFPAVGDWVMVDRTDGGAGNAVIHHTLRRKSLFTRKAAGTRASEEQVIAANIDTVFLCASLDADFNVRRLERYLAIAWDSGARPVIVLTKADLCGDTPRKRAEAEAVAAGADVIVCSSNNPGGWDGMAARVMPGETAAFIGSSGVGKSTLINRLAGDEILATARTRESDGKGRHTTTHRQLVLLPGGGMVIDTPGMRELAIFTADISKTFGDIEELAAQCKFSDCSHTTEPGCAVRRAVESGALDPKRLENRQKLEREAVYEGMNSRQRENEKISRMFGGKSEMKQTLKQIRGRKR